MFIKEKHQEMTADLLFLPDTENIKTDIQAVLDSYGFYFSVINDDECGTVIITLLDIEFMLKYISVGGLKCVRDVALTATAEIFDRGKQ
jgi:hypothetical protein